MDIQDQMFEFFMKFYKNGEKENPRFFQRLGNPSLQGDRVLEIGCGTGSLSVYMVEQLGVAWVKALDIDHCNIEFARTNIACNLCHLADRIEYNVLPVEQLPDSEMFDTVVAKDTFEHIIEFETVFRAILRHLKPGGRLIAGWGPLYYSYRGGHALTHFPYDHLFLPEKILLRRINCNRKSPVKSIRDYGLNKMKLSDYLDQFDKNGLYSEFFAVNQYEKIPMGAVLQVVKKLPLLRDLMVFNTYVILRKPGKNF